MSIQTQTGLWFHAFNFIGRHHFARARWARGNCWITISIPEVLELLSSPSKFPHLVPQLSRTDAFWSFLTETLRAQIEALVELQDKSGLWHTLLDDPASYVEASASAGFAAGILKALRLRLIPREERYIACARRAVDAILGHIGENGELQQVDSISFETQTSSDNVCF
jgi:unsaturated rhamnogalacturonyl hydrolase